MQNTPNEGRLAALLIVLDTGNENSFQPSHHQGKPATSAGNTHEYTECLEVELMTC